MADTIDYIREYNLVRTELSQLKTCQLTYLSLSITGTGIILGLVSNNNIMNMSLVYLFPLFILIPAGLIFFDKSVTISRAVGYIRFLEDIIYRNNILEQKKPAFCGWENSLAKWRDFNYKNDLVKKTFTIKNIYNFFIPWNNSLRYFTIVSYIFLGMSWGCLLISLLCYSSNFSNPEFQLFLFQNYVYFAVIIVLFVFTYVILNVAWKLSFGKYSYEHNYSLWKKILLEESSPPIFPFYMAC